MGSGEENLCFACKDPCCVDFSHAEKVSDGGISKLIEKHPYLHIDQEAGIVGLPGEPREPREVAMLSCDMFNRRTSRCDNHNETRPLFCIDAGVKYPVGGVNCVCYDRLHGSGERSGVEVSKPKRSSFLKTLFNF